MARDKQPKPVHQLTASQFDALFQNEEIACAYLVARRWPEGVRCPRCGALRSYRSESNPWHWQCYECAPDDELSLLAPRRNDL